MGLLIRETSMPSMKGLSPQDAQNIVGCPLRGQGGDADSRDDSRDIMVDLIRLFPTFAIRRGQVGRECVMTGSRSLTNQMDDCPKSVLLTKKLFADPIASANAA